MATETTEKVFSGAADSKLPDHIKELSLEKRQQFVGAWNGRFESCQADGGSSSDCEGSAFAVANAAVKKELTEADRKEMSLETAKFFAQVTQDEAAYNPLGATEDRGCANCRWFVQWRDGGSCAIVEDWPLPIVSNGNSNRWEAIPTFEPSPMPVIIIEGEREAGFLERVAETVKSVLTVFGFSEPAAKPEPLHSFYLQKSADGSYSWFALVSNNFRDRDEEIITDAAHKDFVEYLDDGGTPPELWYWHIPGSRWGVADWWDYSDGVLAMSGTVDAGMEGVAEKMAEDDSLGVSHGFRYTYHDDGDGLIGWYRTFEVSPLPWSKAANPWTGFSTIAKEMEAMQFTPEKRAEAVDKFGEARVAGWESVATETADGARRAGADSKEVAQPEGKKDDVIVDDKVIFADTKEIAVAAAEALVATPAFKALADKWEGTSNDLTTIKERLDALEKSEDEKVAAVLRGNGARSGFRASQSKSTETKDDSPEASQSPEVKDFLDEVTLDLVGVQE